MVVRVRFPLRVHDFIILMKGDIIYNLIKLLQNKEVGQTFRYTYLQSTGAKTAYLYWLCCLLCRAGYIKRVKNGIFQVVKNTSDLGSCKIYSILHIIRINMESRYDIIKSFSQVKRLVKACLKTGIASVDFETNAEGIYNKTFKPTILSVTFQVGSGVSIPLCHHEYENPHWKRWLKYFGRKVVENPNITKVGWNLKFDLQIFELYGIYVRGTVLDGMLMKYLLNEEKPNDLKSMVRRYLPEHGDYEKAEKFDKIPWDKKPLEPLCKYGCQDTDYTLRLAMFFESKLIEIGMYPLFRHLIMPASRVLQHAEKPDYTSIGNSIRNCLNLTSQRLNKQLLIA